MMKRSSQKLSSSQAQDEQLFSEEAAALSANLNETMLEDVETVNRLSTTITLVQLDRTLSLLHTDSFN